jgi:hypothetical protein
MLDMNNIPSIYLLKSENKFNLNTLEMNDNAYVNKSYSENSILTDDDRSDEFDMSDDYELQFSCDL